MPRLLKSVFLVFFLLFFCSACVFAEDITITTYYPSPYGVYNTLRLYPNNNAAAGDACANAGEMFYNQTSNQVLVCNGSTSKWQSMAGGGACPAGFTNVQAAGNQLGCMETAEHGSASFQVAADTCFTTYGGRLPIYSEWYITMKNYVLIGETDAWEWMGNSDYSLLNRECALAGATSIDWTDATNCGSTYAYRCWIPR